jgi:oligopeptide/dipeptide ABC transporter ATP-binding protein
VNPTEQSFPADAGVSLGTGHSDDGYTGPVLRVQDLSTVFGAGKSAVRAVRSVSFEIGAGETLVLLGESGSGKSVTARSIMRLLGDRAKVEGEVWLAGQSLLQLSDGEMRRIRGQQIALVPQDPGAALDPLRRVGKQVAEVLQVHKATTSRSVARVRAIELLRLVGIPDPIRVSKSYPHELSGGMRQRVAIAIAISCEPKVVIADEPTTALDVTVQAQILELFADLQVRSAMALLMVTHDVLVAADVADVVAVMYAGQIVEMGPAREVLENPRHPYTKGLLAASPRPEIERGDLESIPGSPPLAGADFVGCPFADRCSYVTETCREVPPPLVSVADRHLAACPVLNPGQTATWPLTGHSEVSQ